MIDFYLRGRWWMMMWMNVGCVRREVFGYVEVDGVILVVVDERMVV